MLKNIKIISLLLCLFILAGCSKGEPASGAGGSLERGGAQSDVLQFSALQEGDLIATLQTNKGDIVVVLYPQYAPLAVQNFCELAEEGYYNNSIFHRVVQDFIIQGGDATGTGEGGKNIWGTAFSTEISNKLHHYSGALCVAAKTGQEGGSLSQFYVVATPAGGISESNLEALQTAGYSQAVIDTYRQAGGAPYLDNTDTVFGQVYAGMDVVDAIAATSTDSEGRPKSEIKLKKVILESYVEPVSSSTGSLVTNSSIAPASGSGV